MNGAFEMEPFGISEFIGCNWDLLYMLYFSLFTSIFIQVTYTFNLVASIGYICFRYYIGYICFGYYINLYTVILVGCKYILQVGCKYSGIQTPFMYTGCLCGIWTTVFCV